MYQHHVAISLFVNVLRARQNSYLSASDNHGLFGVYFTEGHVGNQMGWVMVSDNASGASYWNKRLKDRMDVHCLFSNDRHGPIPRVGYTVDPDRDWQALQVSAVYPVRTLTMKAAAQKRGTFCFLVREIVPNGTMRRTIGVGQIFLSSPVNEFF